VGVCSGLAAKLTDNSRLVGYSKGGALQRKAPLQKENGFKMQKKPLFKLKAGRWQMIVGLLLVALGLATSFQTVSQASDELWGAGTSNVRTDSTDRQMFGKIISTERVAPKLDAAQLKPANGPIIPVRVRIPALKIDTNVESVGLRAGAMDVPSNIWDLGWLNTGAKPGEVGNAVLAGHKDSTRGTAVFWDLHNLAVGDKIYVSDKDGNELTFQVKAKESYFTKDAPLERIFGTTMGKQLNLIGCDGTFIPSIHTYDKRMVIYTELV
jgi:LPXTG-site transpeptidase (sortase) family protein